MLQYQFIVPKRRYSDKEFHRPMLWTLLNEHLLDIAGGFTTDIVSGGWRDKSGNIIVDDSIRYTVAIKYSDFSLLQGILKDCLIDFDQECIYLAHPSGSAELFS